MEYSGTEVGNFGTVGGGSCETRTLNQYIFLSTQYIHSGCLPVEVYSTQPERTCHVHTYLL